nr:mitochondrial inner membrane protein oxa1l [Quercus suber]
MEKLQQPPHALCRVLVLVLPVHGRTIAVATMMPSRGFRLAQNQFARLRPSQNRNLSSITRIPCNPSHLLLPSSALRKPLQWRAGLPVAITTTSLVRNASTTPATAAPQPTETTPSPSSSISPTGLDPSIDTITFDNKIEQATEGVGYLHQLGLDYGWGPTSILQWVLEQSHFTLGLPWWAAIAATGISLRLVMVPLFIKSADSVARQTAMVPLTKPITDDMWRLRKENKHEEAMKAAAKLSVIKKQAGISMKDIYVPLLLQAVFGYCGFKLMRAMALLPVPGLDTGGFLWLTDLTVTDPFFIAPIFMGLAMHTVIRLGGESGSTNIDAYGQNIRNAMLYGMPAMIVLATVWQPAALCMWFMSTGTIGLAQGLLLQRPSIRSALGIAPVYKPAPGEATGLDQIKSMFSNEAANNNQIKTNLAPEPGKNAQYMRPQYQAPRVIDVKLTDKSAPTASTAGLGQSPANAPAAEGVLGHLKGRFQDARKLSSKWAQDAADKRQRDAQQQRESRAYEERAKRLQQSKKR